MCIQIYSTLIGSQLTLRSVLGIGRQKTGPIFYRTEVRNLINSTLRTITDDAGAEMKWKKYEDDVVSHYRVAIIGWPSDIPFENLSESNNGIGVLKRLLVAWQDSTIKWAPLTEEQYSARRQGIDQAPVVAKPRKIRSDKGKKRARTEAGVESAAKRLRLAEPAAVSARMGPTDAGESGAAGPALSDTDHGSGAAGPVSGAVGPMSGAVATVAVI